MAESMTRHDFADLEEASLAAAEWIASAVSRAVDDRGRCAFALTGGSTPRRLYQLMAEMSARAPWERVDWLWGDERCVAPDDPESNYRLGFETFLEPAAVPGSRIHRVKGEIRPIDDAARHYEMVLDATAPDGAIDVVLLGMGDDGHIASLFPGHPALAETDRRVIAVEGPEHLPIRERITLTLPAINAAREVIFLVAGTRKRSIVDEIFVDQASAAARYPAGHVAAAVETVWFVG